jgi:hypothetical protein
MSASGPIKPFGQESLATHAAYSSAVLAIVTPRRSDPYLLREMSSATG